MGPLVPDIVTDQLNLVIAVLLGIAFGFVLEQAGFSSSRKLTGLFYGTDFTVLRVFFTAGVTAMTGVLAAAQFGWLDPELIYINPTFLHSALIGGAIMGVGFVVGGYCPGTSFCGAAVGRLDAMTFAAGGVVGIFAFGEAFPRLQDLYKAGSRGDLLASTALGVSDGQLAAAIIAAAVLAFAVTTRLERAVNPASESLRFPVTRHRLAGALLLVVAAVLLLVPSRKDRLMAKSADPAFAAAHPVRLFAADELAIHILDRDLRLQLVDARDATEFARATLPGAANITPAALLGKEARNTLQGPYAVKVFFGRDQGDSIRAASLARLAGVENVAALEGGLDGFRSLILGAPAVPPPGVDAGTAAFRVRAGTEIAALIRLQSGPKPVKVARRVQGGCGG